MNSTAYIFSLVGAPEGFLIDSSTGLVVGAPTATVEETAAVLVVNDGSGAIAAVDVITIRVRADPPFKIQADSAGALFDADQNPSADPAYGALSGSYTVGQT
jgi:hypothetical protein